MPTKEDLQQTDNDFENAVEFVQYMYETSVDCQ